MHLKRTSNNLLDMTFLVPKGSHKQFFSQVDCKGCLPVKIEL